MSQPPNVIFIFSDQQRADTIGQVVNGNPVTPTLTELAKEGSHFPNTITCVPVCGPARGCIQTGTFCTENHIFRNGIGLDAQPQNKDNTLAKWFRDGGYEVGYIGKWHLATNSGKADIPIGEEVRFNNIAIPLERRGGFDQYWLGVDALEHSSHGYNGMEDLSWKDGKNPKGFMFDKDGNRVEFSGYRVDAETDFVLDYIEKRSSDKPWFLFTSYIEPHHQNDHNRYEGPEGSKERFAFTKEEVPKDLWGADWLMKGDWEENYADYLGQCWSLDLNVKRIVDKLKEKNMWENTVFVYTSDHGSHFRTREGEYKRNPTDGCLRIPMVIHGPGFNGGNYSEEMVSLLDIVPTILQAAGIEIPSHIRGLPLQTLINTAPENLQWREYVFSQIHDEFVGRAIRSHKWKYAIRAPGLSAREYSSSKLYVEEFLFDLENDPSELINLVDEPSLEETRQQLREIMTHQMEEIGENRPQILPSMKIIKNPKIGERGNVIEEDGIIMMELNMGGTLIPIPLEEILEEIFDQPILLNINEETHFGQFSMKEEDVPIFIPQESQSPLSFPSLFGDLVGKYAGFHLLKPTEKSLKEVKAESPKYHFFVIS